MKEWRFKDNVVVYEVQYIYDVNMFIVCINEKYAYTIYPCSFKDMKICKKRLDSGISPTSKEWEEKIGNPLCIYLRGI